jgi:hypothetical protein
VTPGYSTAAVVTTAVLAFGIGIAIGASMELQLHGGTVVYHNSGYYGNCAWHGGYYGSSATAYGPNGVAKAGNAYDPSTGTYAGSTSALIVMT